jgi:hypothetical protein
MNPLRRIVRDVREYWADEDARVLVVVLLGCVFVALLAIILNPRLR